MFKRFLRSIRNFFRPRPSIGYGEAPTLPISSKDIVLIVGHNKNAKGAEGFHGSNELGYGYRNEYDYNKAVASNSNKAYILRDGIGISGAVKEAAKVTKDISIELHCNAFNGKVKGYEILYLAGDGVSEAVANKILLEFESEFPDRNNRGLKPISRGGRGYKNLKLAKNAGIEAPLILESFFIDNPSDYLDAIELAEFLEAL